MTKGNPWKLIFLFALPLMAGNVFQQLYSVLDTMIVGHLGVHVLAALGASEWLNFLMLNVIAGLTQGFAIDVANSYGAQNKPRLKRAVGNSILLSAIAAIVFLLLGQLLLVPILRLLQTPMEAFPYAVTYMRIIFSGIPFIMAYNLFAGILRSLGDSKTPLYVVVVSTITNFGFDCLFVFVFQ